MGSDSRNRISVTLSDKEMEVVKMVAGSLGIKPTRVVYESLRLALPTLLQNGQTLDTNLRLAKTRSEHERRVSSAFNSDGG